MAQAPPPTNTQIVQPASGTVNIDKLG